MASIYSRIDKNGNKKYYGSIYHNGKRIRKFLGNSNELAEAALKKLEYELLFNIQNFITKHQIPFYEKAILSFLKEVERTSVKVKQISDIHTKLNYFKDYCFSHGITNLSKIQRIDATSYMNYRSTTSLTPSTLNKEIGFIKRFFNHCIMVGWTNLNPFFGIKYIKDRRNLNRYFFNYDDLSVIMESSDKYHEF